MPGNITTKPIQGKESVPINSLSQPILSCLCSQRRGKTKSSLHTIFLLGNFRIKMVFQNVYNPRKVFPEMPVSKCQHHPAACPQGLHKKVVLLPVCVFSLWLYTMRTDLLQCGNKGEGCHCLSSNHWLCCAIRNCYSSNLDRGRHFNFFVELELDCSMCFSSLLWPLWQRRY